MTNKFKVEIWSDVTCVHCYIAKRKFEKALSQFQHAKDVEIIWRSYELAPNLSVKPDKDMYQFLAEFNGASIEQVKHVCTNISNTASEVGLTYNFDIAVPANSFLAHRFSHLAKHRGLQNQVEEALFRAHFTEGKNIADIEVLIELGIKTGLDEKVLRNELSGDKYADEVKQDISEASRLGIRGVPYYLFNSKHSIYGAKEADTFSEVLEKAYLEWMEDKKNDKSLAQDAEGAVCEIGGHCL